MESRIPDANPSATKREARGYGVTKPRQDRSRRWPNAIPDDKLFVMTDIPSGDLQSRLTSALSGQYRIVRLLGQGGMGSVFLAQDESLDRPVAIKVVLPDVAGSAEVRQRFVQESRTVARLRHPNIVAVYAAGEADGLLYFVMEYVPGESLRDRLTRERKLATNDAIAILRDRGRRAVVHDRIEDRADAVQQAALALLQTGARGCRSRLLRTASLTA